MGNLYNYINNAEYLKSKIASNVVSDKDNSKILKVEFICAIAIKKISACIIDYIQGNNNLENETVYSEVTDYIINNILKYADKFSVGFVIFTFKCLCRIS